MKVILHCSASEFGNAAMIAKWHLERGWRTIGYHIVILNGQLTSNLYNKSFDGHIETGRAFDDDNKLVPAEYGAHTIGENSSSISIVLIGESGAFNAKQIKSLRDTVLPMLYGMFGHLEISQHSDHDIKKPFCAGLPVEFINALNAMFG